jgi:spore maturation protein CgeB
MNLKKVYLFASISSQYGVVNDFTRELSNALNRQGVISRIIEAKRDDPKSFLEEILKDPPDCTLSFNGLLPDEEGRFLADLIKIPHVACLLDAPHHFFSLIKSHYNIITCIDQNFCQTFRDFQFPNVIFLPHAVSKTINPLLEPLPVYDVLMLNSFIDYDVIRQSWSHKYSPELCAVLDEAAEWTLSDPDIPYLQAFVQTLDHHLRLAKAIDPNQIDYEGLLDDLESYIGGKIHIELLRSIKDVTVHVFGSQEGGGWKKYLGNKHPHIKLHAPVPFSEAIELMKRAKIVLNCTPKIKQGLHERLLNSLACGAAVLTLSTPFLRENFKDEEDILLFHPRRWEELNHKIQTYIQDEDKRYHLVGKGREKVMKHHTWDQRAQTLIQELPPIIEKIRVFQMQ